ncbi:MAG: asparagine synthase (glutamine-hydrolyzing) [candidate division WOR-3 bacterium]|nr:MAG: asparagine synthase (glutamine-hydrolyzing) [candidate division WOR-3 bacterium]
MYSFNQEKVESSQIKRMMSAVKHRGPDDEGLYLDKNVGLGHMRLSIIDLTSAGRQPMFDQSNRYCIIHNGEIYNYLELRNELDSKYRFVSRTDTEVVLYSFIEWGIECLKKFIGMFAFAIYDTETGELFLVRDRFGIKPLYYYCDNATFVFASEIKGVLQTIPSLYGANDTVIFDYLVYNRTDQYDDTFYSGVKRLGHGQYAKVSRHNVEFHRWYKLPEEIRPTLKSSKDFKDLLADSVRIHLRSDVPVGVCLSGGLDSSSIVAIMTRILEKNDLHTFSAVYGAGVVGDEGEYIDLFDNSVFRMHKVTPTVRTLLDDLDMFVSCQQEPVATTGPYAQFKVMQLARGTVKVLLDGQGGDEILGGYHYFFGNYYRELLTYMHLLTFLKEVYHYFRKHRSLYAFKSLLYFLLPNAVKSRAKLVGRNYLNPSFYEREAGNTRLAATLFDASSLRDALLNHFEYKLEHLLKWEDRNSMWYSLESRVPLLDHRIVEGVLALNPNEIIHAGENKSILRRAMQEIVPQEILRRQDKVGFMTPEDEWFRESVFQTYVMDIMHSASFRLSPYVDYRKCLKLYDLHLRRKINISRDIWKWINLELWLNNLSERYS